MARKGRKYIMNVTEVQACGLGSFGDAVTYSLLNSFSISTGSAISGALTTTTTTSCGGQVVPQTTNYCTYPALTEDELKALPSLEYDERVVAFLDYLKVGDSTIKENLLTEANIDDPNCDDSFCLLNENFLVYKFLTGIRVINVGYANGIVQYKVYPDGANPNDYSWQNNGTFLSNINLNGVYIVEIRDWLNNEELCKYSQSVSLASLTPSTTITLSPVVARLHEITQGEYSGGAGNYEFRTGCFQFDPLLSGAQSVQVCYRATNNFLGEYYSVGCSCVELTCKPSGCIDYTKIACYTNNSPSPSCNCFNLQAGDTVCYTVYSCVAHGSYGAVADASLTLTGINGLSTVEPSIDLSNSVSAVQTSDENLGVVVSFQNNVCSTSQAYYSAITGCINFSPSIPVGYYIDVEFSAITQTTNNGSSFIRFYTGNTANQCTCVCEINNFCTQPQTPVLRVYGGKYAHYRATVGTIPVGSIACAKLCINDAVGSFGINPIPIPNECKAISIDIDHLATDITFYVCNIWRDSDDANGFINVSTPISTGNYAEICFVYGMVLGATHPTAGYTSISFFKRPAGGPSYSPVCTLVAGTDPNWGSAIIRMDAGDSICYSLCAINYFDPVGASISMAGFSAYSGSIAPHVDINKNFDYAGIIIA